MTPEEVQQREAVWEHGHENRPSALARWRMDNRNSPSADPYRQAHEARQAEEAGWRDSAFAVSPYATNGPHKPPPELRDEFRAAALTRLASAPDPGLDFANITMPDYSERELREMGITRGRLLELRREQVADWCAQAKREYEDAREKARLRVEMAELKGEPVDESLRRLAEGESAQVQVDEILAGIRASRRAALSEAGGARAVEHQPGSYKNFSHDPFGLAQERTRTLAQYPQVAAHRQMGERPATEGVPGFRELWHLQVAKWRGK